MKENSIISIGNFAPHPKLVENLTRPIPDLRNLNPASKEIQDCFTEHTSNAFQDLVSNEISRCSLQFHTSYFRTAPLETILKSGVLIALDVDHNSMLNRKLQVSRELARNFYPIQCDSSLFATNFLHAIHETLSKYRKADDPLLYDICQTIDRIIDELPYQMLPLMDESVDFWVANNHFSRLINSAFKIFDIFTLEQLDKQSSDQYFTESDYARTREVIKRMGNLRSAFIQRHFEEAYRILKIGGRMFISDQLFSLICYGYCSGGLGVFPNSCKHSEQMLATRDISIEGKSPLPHIFYIKELKEPVTEWTLSGKDLFSSIAQRSGLKLIKTFLHWGDIDYDYSGDHGKIHLNQALVAVKTAP